MQSEELQEIHYLHLRKKQGVEIDITGDSIDLRTHAYEGSGRIRNLNSLDEAFVRDGYEGSGTVTISGIALVQVQLFQPPFTQVWII